MPGVRRVRRRSMVAGAMIGSSRARKNASAQQQPAPVQTVQPVVSQPEQNSSDPMVEKLKQLSELRDKGILTEEEFVAKKKQILGI